MKKKFLCLFLCMTMFLSCIGMPYVSAAESDLFSLDFETGYSVGDAVNANAKIMSEGDNKFVAFYSSETQNWPSYHKEVAMTPGQTTCFEGKVKLVDSDTVTSQSYYLEYRSTSPTGQGYRQQIFSVSAKSINLNQDATVSYGTVVPDKWIKYTVYVTPGLEGETTKVVAVVDAIDEQSLKNASGEYVSQIMAEAEKVMDNIYVYQNNKANMVHNNAISDTSYSAMNYLDDIRIYNVGSNVFDNSLEYINLDDALISGFNKDKTAYSAVLPFETESAKISVKAKSDSAVVKINESAVSEITVSEFPAEISITVTPEKGSTKTYTVALRKKISANEVASSLVAAKDNAKSIITMVYDDGFVNTAEFNNEMFKKYGLEGSTVIITNNLSGNSLTRMQAVVEDGYVDVSSHSTTHTKIDSSYNTPEILQYELVDSKNWLEEKFPSVDTVTFCPSNNTITAEGWEVVKDTYWAMRSGNRGYNTLDPKDGTAGGQWYNLYMRGIGDVSTTAERNAWVDTAVKNNNWMIEMWHGVGEGGYQPVAKPDAEEHYKYIAEQQDLGNTVVLSFTNATKYIRERQVSTPLAYMIDENCVGVEVTFDSSDLPVDIFDYPLTVKVEVPEGWGAVNSIEDGKNVVKTTFVEDGKNYVLANVVPNSDVHTLTKVENSTKLNNIRINGYSMSGFESDVLSYDIKAEVSEFPLNIVAEAQDANATVEYSNQSINTMPATETITVTAANGESTVYTLNVTRAASTDSTLSNILVNGEAVVGFDPAVTSYRVKTTDAADKAIVKAIATDSAYATVTYNPAAKPETPDMVEVSLPATVTIKVAAENGTIKTYTVLVESRGGDAMLADDNFESYKEGDIVAQGSIWDGTNSYETNGFKVMVDPDDSGNMIGRAFNLTGGNQNQQLNKYIGGTTTEPIVISGRYKGIVGDTTSHTDFLVRGDGINLVSAGDISNGGNIKVGNTTLSDKYVNGEWINFIYVIKQGTGKYEITAYFYGKGISNKFVKATGVSNSNAAADMSNFNCRILIRGNVTDGEANGMYMDDIKIYSPGVFKVSMPATEDINIEESGQLTVETNRMIDKSTFNNNSVIITGENNSKITPSEIIADNDTIIVKFSSYVPDGNYTLTLDESAKDIIGQSASNSVAFNVKNTAYNEITALAVGVNGVLEQPYNNLSEVKFTASTTPVENVNARQICWYVDDVMQNVNGKEFNFTPSECGTSYKIYAKAGDVVSEEFTITVEAHPIVDITALNISTKASLNQTLATVAPVEFIAATTPAEYVDNSTINWYVNGEKQEANGNKFTYTPAACGEYAVCAKVGETVVSNVLTIAVTEKEIKADDVLYYEDFNKTEGTVIAGTKGTNALETYNLNGEMVGKAWKKASDQIQYYIYLPKLDYKPIYFTGKYMYPQDNTGSFNLWLRGGANIKPFESDTKGSGMREFGNSGFTVLKSGAWAKYIVVIIPNKDDMTKSQVRLIWSGPGLKSGNYKIGTLRTMDLSSLYTSNVRFMLQYYPTNSDDKSIALYTDDVKLYNTTSFIASLKEDSVEEKSVAVKFNHEAMPDTLVKENITVTDSKGNIAEIESIEVDYLDLNEIKINFKASLAQGETYTVKFNENLIDIAGIPMDNKVTFATEKAEVPGETLSVSAIGGTVNAVVDGGNSENWENSKTGQFAQGTRISLTAVADDENQEFMFWKSENGAVLSTEAAYEFIIGSDRTIEAVFADKSIGHYVTFKNVNGRILTFGLSGSGITVPQNPYMAGYVFDGWYIGNDKQTLAPGYEITNLEADIVLNAGYIKSDAMYNVTVNGTASQYTYNSMVEVTAEQTNASGETFAYWTKDGKIVSYDASYKFYVAHNTVLVAVYSAEAETKQTTIVMSEPVIVDNNRLAFYAERNVPEEYTVIESGILIGREKGLSLDKYDYKRVVVSNANKGQFTVRKANVSEQDTWYGVGYVIYTDGENIYTQYSNEVPEN